MFARSAFRFGRTFSGKTGRNYQQTRHFGAKKVEPSHLGKYIIGGLLGGAAVLGFYELYDYVNEMVYPPNDVPDKKPKGVSPEFVQKMQKLLGNRCDTDQGTRDFYGKDLSANVGKPPDVVVFPKSTEEVSEIVKLCAQYKVPIIPFGSGTSLEGHITAPRGGVCISFSEMKQVVQVFEKDMSVTVQPGISYSELNEKLTKYGLFFPMDPGPNASIGGMVGTSCSGTNAVRYGTMKENVLSLTVVLPNGKIVKTRQRVKKSSAGYDLTHLFVGSEGTLGVVTQITLKLSRIPESKVVAVCQFPNIDSASETAFRIIQRGTQIGKMELLDEVMIKAINMAFGLSYKEAPTLFFELSGTKAQVEEQREALTKVANEFNGMGLKFATTQEERDVLWRARKEALLVAPTLMPGSEVKITDVCVPISRFPDMMKETKEDLKKSFLKAPLVAHAGDGNFHLFILMDSKNPKHVQEAKRIDHNLIDRAIRMDGTCTGEHGIGVGKREHLLHELGPEAVELMKMIKETIDPNNIMNPGKILPDEYQPKEK